MEEAGAPHQPQVPPSARMHGDAWKSPPDIDHGDSRPRADAGEEMHWADHAEPWLATRPFTSVLVGQGAPAPGSWAQRPAP